VAQLLACAEGSWPGVTKLDINSELMQQEPSELLAALVRLCPRLEAAGGPLAPAALRALAPAARSLRRLALALDRRSLQSPRQLALFSSDSSSDSDPGSDIEPGPPSELEARPAAAAAAAPKDGLEVALEQLDPRAGVCAALAALTGLTELHFDVCGQGWDWEPGTNPSGTQRITDAAEALTGLLEALPRLPRLAVLQVPLVERVPAAPLAASPALRELEVVVQSGRGRLGAALLRGGVAPGVKRLRAVVDR
jgi:hypothetical protein